VKLSYKFAKIFCREAQRRGWRRFQRKLYPIPLQPLLDRIDHHRLREIQGRYATAPTNATKYLDVERWLKTNIERVQDLKLNRLPSHNIVDLGCGAGYFLFICQQLGHRCLGMDIDTFPMFGELTALLGVERRVWEIKALEPLPDLGRKFDLITAFSVTFNRQSESQLWTPNEWGFFLDDLEQHHLNPGGRIFLALNPQHGGWFYTAEVRDYFVRRGATIERERILFESKTSF
jgi:SAM-dependent methyltransferase